MVYMEPVYLGWEPIVETWAELMEEIISDKWLTFIAKSLMTAIKYILPQLRKNCKESIPSQDCNLVQSALNLV
jgi:uncharacterized membrane protein